MGCDAKLKVVFPRQDQVDRKIAKAKGKKAEVAAGTTAVEEDTSYLPARERIKKDIQDKIKKLITTPQLYEEFKDSLKSLKEKRSANKIEEMLKTKANGRLKDHQKLNFDIATNIQDYNLQKYQ